MSTKSISILAAILCLFSNVRAETKAEHPSEMHAYRQNGFVLSGAEYWVYISGKEFEYPNDVLWGFLGESRNDGSPGETSELAQACALLAYNKLNAFYTNPPQGMKALIEKGKTTNRFYLWVNDYTKASINEIERPNNFWHWNSGPKDYSQGYYKWESTLTHSGDCTIPTDEQINSRILEITKKLKL